MADRSLDVHPDHEFSNEELRTNEVLEPFFNTPEGQRLELGKFVSRGYTRGRKEGVE